MSSLEQVLLILAAIAFAAASGLVLVPPRYNLIAVGLFLWVLTVIF